MACCSQCGRAAGHVKTCERYREWKAARNRRLRQERVASGLCGYCSRPRNLHDWLCDECADRHRERQRDPLKMDTPQQERLQLLQINLLREEDFAHDWDQPFYDAEEAEALGVA